MLAFKNRFHGHGGLRYVYKNGVAKHSARMTIKTTENTRRRQPRIAIVVSKKVLKSAVGRNRIRRRLYELFRHELPALEEHHDIVCIVTSPEVYSADSEELKQELTQLLQGVNLYRQ